MAAPIALSMALALAVQAAGLAEPNADPSIASDSSCPSSSAVLASLRRLAPAPTRPPVSIRVGAGEKQLTIEFSWGDQATPDSRRLDVDSDCGARADVAALVIASWLGELSAEALPAPMVQLEGPRLPPPTLPAPPPRARRSELGAGLLAAAGGSWTAGLRLEVARAPDGGSGFGWDASAIVVGPRDVALGPGITRWMRIAAGAGARARLATGVLDLEAHAGPAVALLIAWGRGYEVDGRDASLTWGITGGARLCVPWGGVRLWADAGVFAWLRAQEVRHTQLPAGMFTVQTVPGREGQFVLGASYVFR